MFTFRMSISISRLLNVKAKLELLVLLSVEYPDELLGDSANSEWKYAGRMITAYWFAKLGPEPLADVTNEAVALAVNNADLCIFVDRLFLDDEPLYIPGVTPSSELIPAVIKVGTDFYRCEVRNPTTKLHGSSSLEGGGFGRIFEISKRLFQNICFSWVIFVWKASIKCHWEQGWGIFLSPDSYPYSNF